jgi:hypothetical protein
VGFVLVCGWCVCVCLCLCRVHDKLWWAQQAKVYRTQTAHQEIYPTMREVRSCASLFPAQRSSSTSCGAIRLFGKE